DNRDVDAGDNVCSGHRRINRVVHRPNIDVIEIPIEDERSRQGWRWIKIRPSDLFCLDLIIVAAGIEPRNLYGYGSRRPEGVLQIGPLHLIGPRERDGREDAVRHKRPCDAPRRVAIAAELDLAEPRRDGPAACRYPSRENLLDPRARIIRLGLRVDDLLD